MKFLFQIFLSLTNLIRYALREGASAIAVDVEDVANFDIMSGQKTDIKIVPHAVQRRGEADCRKLDKTS